MIGDDNAGPNPAAFFTERLRQQRHASDETVRAYRDTWKLLVGFAAARTGKQPSSLDIDDFNSDLIAAFLDHLEHDRHNSVRTRNARLSAIHSLFRFAASRHPEHAATISRVLAMPSKRFERRPGHLPHHRARSTPCSPHRTPQPGPDGGTGLSCCSWPKPGCGSPKLIGLRRNDIHLGAGAHVACHGKGRKDRITPLTKPTVKLCATGSPNPQATNRSGLPDTHRRLTDPRRRRAQTHPSPRTAAAHAARH